MLESPFKNGDNNKNNEEPKRKVTVKRTNASKMKTKSKSRDTMYLHYNFCHSSLEIICGQIPTQWHRMQSHSLPVMPQK